MVILRINKKLLENVYDVGSRSEKLVECYFKASKINFDMLNNAGIQKINGDYVVQNEENKLDTVEVKTLGYFRKKKQLTLNMDYMYFTKDGKEYIQKNSDNNLGWLNYLKSDMIIGVSWETNTMYIIKNAREVLDKILDDVDFYYNIVEYKNWVKNGYENYINEDVGLEGSVNKKDYCKDTLMVNLIINEKNVTALGGELKEIKFEIIEDIEDNSSPLF